MAEEQQISMEGGCTCGSVRYRLNARPLFVHCCHCTWCQRETGSAFAVNAMIEASNVELLKGELERTTLPSASGKGQTLSRCPHCGITLWSNYAAARERVHFVRSRNARRALSRTPGYTHIYVHQAAMGPLARRSSGCRRILPTLRLLAGRKHRSVQHRKRAVAHRSDLNGLRQ